MKRLTTITARILCTALLVSALAVQDGNCYAVHAAETSRKEMPEGDWLSDDFNKWLDGVVDVFKYGYNITVGQVAGGAAAGVNGGNIINGMLVGSLLNSDVNYYGQPTKIFDKVNQAYKGDPVSSSTTAPNCYYYYQGDTNSSDTSNYTSNYHVYQDMSDYSTHTYNYQWYNPITNNYNYTNNYQYNYDYNTYYYQQTTENYQYDYYYIDNSTHMTYYIVQTDLSGSADVPEVKEYIYDIYYELPDGRNSYKLHASDIWGQYFLYNTSKYDVVPEDDGTTLGLWHFDGNLEDSSYWNNSVGLSSSLQYSEGVFDVGKHVGGDITLPLDHCSFDPSAPFTLEWRELIPSVPPNYKNGYVSYYFANGVYLHEYFGVINGWAIGEFAHYALVYDGSVFNFFKNGIKCSLHDYAPNIDKYPDSYKKNDYPAGFLFSSDSIIIKNQHLRRNTNEYSQDFLVGHVDSIVDEMRLSKGILYTSDFVPSVQPFDTNEVLVIPDNAIDNTVLFYTRYDYDGYRVGGVRPTYPTDGYIYVNVEDDVVQSVQQYQVNKWEEIDAFLYDNGELIDLAGYDLSDRKVVEPVEPDTGTGSGNNPGTGSGNTPGGSGGDGSDNDSGDDDGGGGILSGIIDFFGSIFGLIGELISVLIGLLGDLVDLITSLISSLFDLLGVFTDFGGGFSDFLGAAFGFIPSEVWSLIGTGISAMVIIAVVKMLLD